MAQKIQIDSEALETIFAYAKHCKVEIQGFAKWNGSIVHSPFIIKQIATGASVEPSQASILRITRSGKLNEFRVQWHSHVEMSCFWSGDDRDVMESYTTSWGYGIFIVVNKRREYKAQLCIHGFESVELDLVPVSSLSQKLIAKIRTEIGEKVTFKKPKIEYVDTVGFTRTYPGMPEKNNNPEKSPPSLFDINKKEEQKLLVQPNGNVIIGNLKNLTKRERKLLKRELKSETKTLKEASEFVKEEESKLSKFRQEAKDFHFPYSQTQDEELDLTGDSSPYFC